MPNSTNEDNYKIKEQLEYIGLELDNIPNFLKEYKYIEYNSLRGYEDENTYKVYKYINVKDIQILITQSNRLDSLREKYTKASPIYSYLVPKKEDDILKHAVFLDMVKNMEIENIKQIEEEQKKINQDIPFKVKYKENYLWQIYYSENSNKYFMLVTTGDLEQSGFFYLLKKQIEYYKNNIETKIFAPICHQEYSGKYLKRSELNDIENYLWLFTKDWPLVYEVYNKTGEFSIQIVGKTIVYEKLKSEYKIVLKNEEESIKFLKLIKALFILQTEIHNKYRFLVKISEKGELEFYYKDNILEYQNLTSFIEKEFLDLKNKIQNIQKENVKLKVKLENLKTTSNIKEKQYINKEREITIYLECKKTFFGKVKYFLKYRKNKQQDDKFKNNDCNFKIENIEVEEEKIDLKQFYTIEDLINISKQYDEKLEYNKNLKLDIDALETKIKFLENKIKNAIVYINEISKHNKSIFEFWKFVNKDEILSLNSGNVLDINKNIKLEKTFDYEEDIEEIGKIIDKNQREKLSKEECDSIFMISTNIINSLNILKKYNNEEKILATDEEKIVSSFNKIKAEENEQTLSLDKNSYDIFGGVSGNIIKNKNLTGKKHRELEKNKLKILDITKNTNINQYKETLKMILKNIDKAIIKGKAPVNMALYKVDNRLNTDEYQIFNINPENAIDKISEDNINLYKLNIKEDMEIIYFSNIIYYDNYNKTLPIGMDISDKALLDMKKYKTNLINIFEFKVNKPVDESTFKIINIKIYEYDLYKKNIDN